MASEVRITVTADDKSAVVLQGTGRNIETIGKSAAASGRGLESMSRAAVGVSNAVERGYAVMTRLDLVQITLQQSAERVAQAQRNYTQAVSEFGPQSQQAIEANRQLAKAQQDAEKANTRARLSYVLVAGDIVALAAKAPAAATAIAGLGTSARTAAAGMTALEVAGGAALTTLGAVGAVLIAVAAFKTYTDQAERGKTATEELRLAQEALSAKGNGGNLFGGPILGTIEKIAGKIPGITTDTESWAKASKRVEDAQAAVNAEMDASRLQKQRDAAVALAQANQGLASSLNSALPGLRNFSEEFQASILSAAGATPDFIASLKPAIDLEKALAGASTQAKVALLEQSNVTAKKDETTEDFHKRLRGLVGEEAYAKLQFDETGRSIVNQAQATRQASDAMTQWQWVQAGGTARSWPGAGGGVGQGGGAVPFAGAGLTGYAGMAAQALVGQSSKLQGTPGSNRLNEFQGLRNSGRDITRNVLSGARNPGVFDAYMEELQILLSQNPGALGNPDVGRYFNFLKNTRPGYQGQQAGYAGQLRQRALPVLAAATGYHGTVNEPTLMLVGEAGRERVDVSPGAQGGMNVGGFTQVLHVAAGADVSAVASAARRGAAQGIQDVQRRRYGLRRSH